MIVPIYTFNLQLSTLFKFENIARDTLGQENYFFIFTMIVSTSIYESSVSRKSSSISFSDLLKAFFGLIHVSLAFGSISSACANESEFSHIFIYLFKC